MNFFNSIFSDDTEPSASPKSPSNEPADNDFENPNHENHNPSSESSSDGDSMPIWNFGSLIKTIATRSESVIGNYKRDFEEFGSGLLKETSLIRDVASRAVKEFPDSIDAGAAVAQESLESVGQAIDNLGSSVWQGTSLILAHGKDLHLFDDNEADDEDNNGDGTIGSQLNERSLSLKKYSWFDSRMREIQGDLRTYTEEPDDLEDYKKWKSGFVLDEKDEEIDKLMAEEKIVERSYLQLVPVTVDKETFWCRYFYKVDKLKQAEEARARIVKRAISGDDEEDLSWDVDDDNDDNDQSKDMPKETLKQEDVNNQVVESSSNVSTGEMSEVGRVSDASESNTSEAKVLSEKNDSSDSCKDSDLSIISMQPSFPGEEEELGWDEIDDVGNGDENKGKVVGNSNMLDLRNRLNATDEDEDLSWDIEDDDEPVKS